MLTGIFATSNVCHWWRVAAAGVLRRDVARRAVERFAAPQVPLADCSGQHLDVSTQPRRSRLGHRHILRPPASAFAKATERLVRKVQLGDWCRFPSRTPPPPCRGGAGRPRPARNIAGRQPQPCRLKPEVTHLGVWCYSRQDLRSSMAFASSAMRSEPSGTGYSNSIVGLETSTCSAASAAGPSLIGVSPWPNERVWAPLFNLRSVGRAHGHGWSVVRSDCSCRSPITLTVTTGYQPDRASPKHERWSSRLA